MALLGFAAVFVGKPAEITIFAGFLLPKKIEESANRQYGA
jgi:hypothetical protein